MSKNNIIFLGQKKIGERCFEYLVSQLSANMQIKAVVTNFSSDVWWGSCGVKNSAGQIGIPCLDNQKKNNKEIYDLVVSEKINTIISIQHPWILSPEILQEVSFRSYNFHNAKLPDYKGHNCCNHAILNEEATYSVTLHQMSVEVDSGFLIEERSFPIRHDETAFSLYQKANECCFEMFREFVDHLKEGVPSQKLLIKPGGVFYPRNSIDTLRNIYDISDEVKVAKLARALYFPPFKPLTWHSDGKAFHITPVNDKFRISEATG